MIDLRSDTITRPSPAMRRVMCEAEVGDMVYGEDPTVRELEERTASILGMEAAIYMPSGTMTNQVGVRVHTEHGDEMLLDYKTHVHYYEVGASAALSGVSCRMIISERGIFSGEDITAALRPFNIHYPLAKLVVLENTHNKGGGAIWPIEAIADVERTARSHNLRMHLDGARLWHATAATGITEREYAAYFDTVSVCFSKGLGAPVGSALAGSLSLIERAQRFRKQFGGGMRQAGIIAAGALYALDNNRERLAEDHENARLLASGLANIPGIGIDPALVETNIVNFRLSSKNAPELSHRLLSDGLYVMATAQDTIRAVTHLDVNRRNIERAIEIVAKALG